MRLEEPQHRATRGVTLVFVLIAAILTTPAALRAQQPAQTRALAASGARTDEDHTIRPFVIKVPEEALAELRAAFRSLRPSTEQSR